MSARELAETLDLEGVPVCAACLLELAWKIRDGERIWPATVTHIAGWIWGESGEAIHAAVVRARMQEVPFAEDALSELAEKGFRSSFARALVLRLARELADDLDAYTI